MSVRKHYRLMDLKKERAIVKKNKEYWKPEKTRPIYFRQSIWPTEKFSIPKVQKKDSILVFAGNTGELSSHIDSKNKIFSDFTPEAVGLAKKHFKKDFKDFLVVDATHLPIKEKSVDWLFSYEPYHLGNSPTYLPKALLTVKKGIIFSHRSRRGSLTKTSRILAKLYGLEETKVRKTMRDKSSRPPPKKRDILIHIFEITPKSREKAKRDLAVLNKINSKRSSTQAHTKESIEKIREELDIPKAKFKETLKRLDKMVAIAKKGSKQTLSFKIEY
ncbi:hypothetical protein K8R43_02205 [archaeon]|nr:hypothetical protein [archaeon]